MTDCLFCKIIARELPTTIVAESDKSLAFNDINPQAPTHVLIVPKAHYTGVAEMSDENELGDLLLLATKIAKDKKLNVGYRLVINQGEHGGQTVHHTHVHLLGERQLTWPPG